MADKRSVDILRLITLVKEKNILWDVTADNYKLSELKPLAWKEIADALESDTSLFSFRVVLAYKPRQNIVAYAHKLAFIKDD